MFSFLALVVAGIAIAIAIGTRNQLHELRRELGRVAPVLDPASRISPEAAPPSAVEMPAEVDLTPAAAAIAAPPPPPPVDEIPRYIPPSPSPAVQRTTAIDWENLVGIRLFSWIAGIALVLAAVFLFKYSVDHGWLRPAIRAAFGLLVGAGLLVVCEMRIARNYRFTANAMDGAGIAILYATLFALHGRWQLWPAWAAFGGMLVVTAVAVFLSTRRDSIFIALLGLLGGFATPALLSSGENRPIALFSYLLLLNGGIAWIAWRKGWPLLTALSVGLTAFYQWSWVERFLTTGQLPLAAAIFLVFAAVGASSLWSHAEGDRQKSFRRIAAAGAVLPLLFAFFTAIVPEYGARYNVLFGFLLLVAAGLAAISLWRGPALLHAVGAAATLITFFIWLVVSYTRASWPLSLVWLAAFVLLYLATSLRLESPALYTAPLLFFVFIGLAIREPSRSGTATGAMAALLAIVVVYSLAKSRPYVAAVALALASIAMMFMEQAPAGLYMAAQLALLITLLVVAWTSEVHALAVVAVPFTVAALAVGERFTDPQQLLFGACVYALFLAYPALLGARVKESIAPHLAAALASFVFFVHAYEMRVELGYESFVGLLPLGQALLMLGLMWLLLRLEPMPSRLVLVAGTALAFLTAAIPLQMEKEWITISWALEAAALAWLFTRIPHHGLLIWSGGLTAIVLARLVLNTEVFAYYPRSGTPVLNWYLYTYVVCAVAAYATAWLAPRLRMFAATAGTIELFVLLNIEIADYFSTGRTLTFNFTSSTLAQDLTYTIGWAVFAIAMLVAGIGIGSRSARVAALGLFVVTILKCFLHDLGRLGGLYRVGSLFGLAISLVLVGLMLQRFVIMRRTEEAQP